MHVLRSRVGPYVLVPLQIGVVFNSLYTLIAVVVVIVPLQIGVVFNLIDWYMDRKAVIVPLQIGVVFNFIFRQIRRNRVIVPLQIGVVFNRPDKKYCTINVFRCFYCPKICPQ